MNTNRIQVGAGSKALAVCAVLIVADSGVAEPVAPRDVTTAVETWLSQVISDARADATIDYLEPYVVDGETRAYIAHLVGGGFCLAGADDRVLPVYLYSPRGK